jgi:hypothetical protein
MKSLVDPQSQTDPSFKSTKLYTRMTASEVRRQLIAQYGYTEEELPTSETIRRKLNRPLAKVFYAIMVGFLS